MAITFSSVPTSVNTGMRSQELEALLEIICSGGGNHHRLSSRLGLVAAVGQPEGDTMQIFFPAAAAYETLQCGVPSRALIALGDYIGIGKSALAKLVGLHRATASRKVASDQPLPMHAAESVLRLLELQRLAEDIFESRDAATAWLLCVHPMLDGDAPLERAKSAYGSEKVKEILVALKYGGVV